MTYDLIVIGAGPGGYVAAIRAAQLGLNVACVEKEASLGGTCVRVGCIPSKAMLESSEQLVNAQTNLKAHGIKVSKLEFDLKTMLARKDKVVKSNTDGVAYLFKKNKISHYQGVAQITAPGQVTVKSEKEEQLSAKHIIIATGSSPLSLPGVEFDGEYIGSSTEALSYNKVPEHLVVIGAGYIGLELGSVWKRLGARVSVLEYLDRILPGMDAEIAKDALKLFKKQGLEFHLGAKVLSVKVKAKRCHIEIDGKNPVDCDRVLLAVGRKANTEGLGLAALGLTLDDRGRIEVNERFETSIPGIYAIGDVIPGPMLAHKAEEDGVACVEYIATGVGHINYDLIPGIVYTEPEIAVVGKTEEQLKEQGQSYKKGLFPYQANGRARAIGHTEGKVKILADAETDRVLGVHIIGTRAGDLIAEAVAAMTFGASSEDIARTVHAHPTLAEIVKEAALNVEGRAIHM